MSETWGYDAAGNETLHIDINGFTSHLTYDDNQLTTQIVDHGATQVDSETWEYDDNGNVISYGDNNGDVTASTYDGEGRLTTQVVLYYDPTSSTETWFYDNDGNVTENIDPLGRTTLTRYNNDGYVTEQVDAAGTSLAATTFTYYDADDNLTEVYVPTVGSTPASTTLFAYDDGMQTLSVNAMGNTSTMWYDADGNMTKEIDADGRTQTFAYNAMGLETSNVWYTSGGTSYQTISYGYDSDGNMTSASDGASSDSMQYDPLGRLTQAVETIGSTSPVTLAMGYDAAGDRTLLRDSLGGTIDYVYDTDSELTTEAYAQNGATMSIVQDYDWLGRVSEQLDYSGSTLVATSSTGYNSQDLVTAINQSNGGSTLIASYSMMYDFDNELSQQIDHGNTTSFGYDALGEVTSYGTASRSYDANGNISGDTVTYGNEVTYDGTYHYQYDKAGNETEMYNSSVTWLYSYDNDNQMTQAQETSAGLTVDANYTYDAFGSQIEESVTTISGGTTTSTAMEYVLDHWNPATAGATGLSGTDVIADMTPTGSLITGYVWSNQVGQLFGRYDTSLSSSPTAGMYYLFTDPNGSVRDIVNSSGADVDSIKYDAYGNIITQTTSSYQGRFTYDSYAYDGATGDYDVNARVYDPVTGRWLSQDPDGIAAGQANLYQYVGNDPTNATDSSGLGDLPGVGDTLWYMVCNPVTTYMTVNDSVCGNIYNGAKGLVNGEAGAALGNKAVGIVENNTGRPFEGTLGQNLSVSKEIGLQLLGITPLAESIIGADAQSGQVIPTTERIQRGAGGVASFAGAAAGGASLVRAIAPTTSVIVTTRGIQVLKTPVPTFSNLPGSGLLAKAPVSTKAPPNPPEPPQAPPQAPKTSPSQPPNCIQPIGEAPKPVVTEYPVESTAPKPVVTEYPVESTAPKPVVTEYPVESTAPTTTTPANSPLLQRYLSGNGGRWGGTATRQLNHRLATDLELQGSRVTGGAGRASEEWIPGPGGGTKGGTWVDITATNGTTTTRIQTVTTLADGVTPTASEAAAAARIRAAFPNDTLILVSKQTGRVIP